MKNETSFPKFQENIVKEIQKHLHDLESVELYEKQKNNGVIQIGVIIKNSLSKAAPVIYLEEFYHELEKGCTTEQIAKMMIDFYRELPKSPAYVKIDFDDFEAVREKIRVKLVNTKENEDFLKMVPHKNMLDMTFVYYLELEMTEEGTASMMITSIHMKTWGCSEKELHNIAFENTVQMLPAYFTTITERVKTLSVKETDLLQEEQTCDKDAMYVLTNKNGNQGAVCMFYPGALEKIGQLIEDNFFLIPSSVHEMLILRSQFATDFEGVNKMIQECNQEIAVDEVLSYHGYFYCRDKKALQW